MDRNDYDEIYEDNEQNNDVNQIQQKPKATNQIKEQVKQQAKEQAKKEVKKKVKKEVGKVVAKVGTRLMANPYFWIAVAIILGVVILIAILIAEFAYIYQGLSSRWDKVTNLWGHLWSGTASQVSDEDISNLYYDLTNQGLDFKELGAVGEHSFLGANQSFIDNPELREEAERKIDKVREQYTAQYYLNTIKESDLKPVQVYKLVDNETGEGQSLVIEHKLDKDGKVVKETKEEAAQRLLSQKLLAIRESEFIESGEYIGNNMLNVDEGIGLYLKRYLLAEAETFTARNDYSFAGEGYRGSIFIDGGEKEKSISDKVIDNFLVASIYISPITAPVAIFQKVFNFVDGMTMVEQGNIDDDPQGELFVKFQVERSIVHPTNYDGDRVTNEMREETFDITEWVNDYAMPWQYPFAFHLNTLSPDVGYEVALMAHKYHNLYLQVRPKESGCVKVFSENGKLKETYSLITPEIYRRQMATWYETVDYDYSTDPHSAWHGKAHEHALNYYDVDQAGVNISVDSSTGKIHIDVETVTPKDVITPIMITTTTTDITYSCEENGDNDTFFDTSVAICSLQDSTETEYDEPIYTDFECTHVWYTDITDEEGIVIDQKRHESSHTATKTTRVKHEYEKQIVVQYNYVYEDNPIVTISDTVSKVDGIEKTGIEAMTELLFPEPEIDIASQTIVNEDQVAKYYRGNILTKSEDGKSKDPLVISTSAEAIIKSICDLYSGHSSSYTNVDIDDIEAYDSSLEDYMTVGLEYNMVRQLIQFFAMNGIVDGSGIGFTETNSFNVMAQWFISGASVSITSSGNIATIATGSGREVTSPVTGRIMKDDDTGYIYIQTEKLGTIYLNNIQLDASVKLGQTISKGQIIGITKGNVSYYRTDDAGQEVQELVNELKQLQIIKFSDYAWPVPDSANITSRFGGRNLTVNGVTTSWHNGLDIGAPERTPIVAYMDGVIDVVQDQGDQGYGRFVKIKHSDDCYTLYGHMKEWAVKAGDTVKKGDVIGYVGSTGRSTGNHLHFEYRKGPNYGDAIDPLSKLSNYREILN